jgi:putative membrane protein insertion efficiency factor
VTRSHERRPFKASRLILLVVSAASVLLAADLLRPPAAQLSTRAALGAIHVYQATLSPLYARTGVICRFKPTCSHYGEVVVREYGVVRGGWLAMKRVLRCGPWTPAGTVDEPPARVQEFKSSRVQSSKFKVQSS